MLDAARARTGFWKIHLVGQRPNVQFPTYLYALDVYFYVACCITGPICRSATKENMDE